MRVRLLSALLLFSLYGSAQPFALGKRTIVFSDNNRSNRMVSTELYYPGATAGTNVPLAAGTSRFPVVVFGHGFLMPVSAYQWLADSLVKYGFIVAFPATESGFAPSHEQFGRDIAFLCQRIMSLTDSASSFLFNRVASKSAAAGHSMGGGASFLAMSYTTAITALFNFAAAETNPSAKAVALGIQRPALIFSGSADCIVPPSTQLEMYTHIPYTCKTYINITNALHCHFGNNEATCSLGQITSGCNSSTLTANEVFQKTMQLTIPFLKFYLQDDCASGSLFQDRYSSLTGVVKQRACTADPAGCVVTGTRSLSASLGIQVLNNFAKAGEPVIIRPDRVRIHSIQLYNAIGQWVGGQTTVPAGPVSFYVHQKGFYFLKVFSGNQTVTSGLLRW